MVVRRVRRGCGEVWWAWRPTRVIAKRSPSLSGLRIWVYLQVTRNFPFCQISPSSLRGAPTSQMGMTTVWRPRVRIAVPNVGDAEGEVEVPEEVNKGHEAEESPSNKGAMRARGEGSLGVQGVQRLSARSSALVKCKECGGASICEHGRQRSRCKECGGSSICEHGRQRSHARSAVGHAICEHGRERSTCKECGGSQYASTVVSALQCKECGGHQSASTVVERSQCKECGGSQSASTVVSAMSARSAVGAGICEHGRQRSIVQGVSRQ